MVDLVDVTAIERFVGVERWTTQHVARYERRTNTIFVLHSWVCVQSLGQDNLNDCPFAQAQDDMSFERHQWSMAAWVWDPWEDNADRPCLVEVGAYGKREGKGMPWHYLRPTARIPETFVPAPDSIARRRHG